MARSLHSPIRCAALAAVVLGACVLPIRAGETSGDTGPASTAPAAQKAPASAAAGRRAPVLRFTPAARQGLALDSRWSTTPLPMKPRGSDEEPRVADPTRRRSFARAFEAELQREAIESRRASLYATIPEDLPELLDDRFISEQRSRAAESVLGGAIEAAATETFFGGRFHETKVTIRPTFAVVKHGLRVGAAPSWSYGIRAPRGGFRVDVPLVPTAIRLHVHRDLEGTDRTPVRFGAGLLIDPFDEEIRAGVSFRF